MDCFRFQVSVRKRNRLRNYDYSSDGFYFVTICVKGRGCWFGNVWKEHPGDAAARIRMNAFGKIVEECWYDLPNHYMNCVLDEFIIMPDHVHGIIVIQNQQIPGEKIGNNHECCRDMTARNEYHGMDIAGDGTVGDGLVGDGFKPSPTIPGESPPKNHSLSEIIRGFKTFSSRRINETNPEITFQWQRSFHDHIIRDERSLDAIRRYIRNNPNKWHHN